MSVFGIFLVRISPRSDWIRARKTPNTDAFHAVYVYYYGSYNKQIYWLKCSNEWLELLWYRKYIMDCIMNYAQRNSVLFIPSIGWSYHWLFYAFLKAIFWNTNHINKNANFFGTITTKTFSLFIFSFFQKHIALAFSKSNFLRGKIW